MSAKPNKLSRFWNELKRRKVLRSLAIYAGSAFVILEATSIIFPRWNFPDWSIDLVLWLLILGAFITLFMAWIFDITSEGVQKTKPFEETEAGEKALSIDSNHLAALGNLVGIYALKGEYRKSIEIWTSGMFLDEDTKKSILTTFDQQGLEASVKEFIGEIEMLPGDFTVDLGQLYTMIGDNEKAMYYYEKAFEVHHPMLPYLPTRYYSVEPFKIDDPAFDSLLVKMNLSLSD